MRAWVLGGLSVGCLCGSVSVGHAAFPGRDGRIAFVWNANTGVAPQSCLDIFSVTPAGSDRQRLTRGCPWEYSEPAYSASGSQIVFVKGYEPFPPHLHGAGIYVMDADGSHVRRITASTSDEGPAFSPDGKWIVFDRFLKRSGRGQLFLASIDGSRTRQLTHGQGAGDATFSPNGRRIAFVGGPGSNIYTMRMDGSHVRQLTHAPDRLDAFYGYPDFSPGGRRIVFVCGSGEGFGSVERICIMRANGTHLRHLTSGKGGFTAIDPVFSPDGRRIAFLAQGHRGPRSENNSVFLYIMRPDGSHLHQIYELGPHQELGSLGVAWQPLP